MSNLLEITKLKNFHSMKKNQINEVFEILSKKYPDPRTELVFETPFQMVMAVMMSAQTTDKQVNRVTAKLFDHSR